MIFTQENLLLSISFSFSYPMDWGYQTGDHMGASKQEILYYERFQLLGLSKLNHKFKWIKRQVWMCQDIYSTISANVLKSLKWATECRIWRKYLNTESASKWNSIQISNWPK